MSRRDVDRAEWHLWVVTFAILGVLAAATIVLATGDQGALHPWLGSRTMLVVALGALVGGFTLYAVDRERGLKRLAGRLLGEQLEAERLSARLASLAELTRERDTNAALLDGSADGVAVIGAEGQILRFNASLESLLGVARDDALGSSIEDILWIMDETAGAIAATHHPARAVLGDGVARKSAELLVRRPDGMTRWVSATFSPIFDAGTPALVLIVLRDIGPQKEAEMSQRDFVSMAAHELRSPLTAIKGFTRTLMTKFDRLEPERRTHYLGLVNEQSNRLARLVDDLMQVSRIDSGRVKLRREAVDIAATIETLLEQFRTKWVDRLITVSSDEVAFADADPHKLEEILINLIDNAVKYSPPGAPVDVGIRTIGGEVEVSIRDHGMGIGPEDTPSLFAKFHRLAQSASEQPGTGLGLYIVKGLIEAHGGRVWVESAPGEGSTFRFILPVADEALALREGRSA